jgi:hypothetical protein
LTAQETTREHPYQDPARRLPGETKPQVSAEVNLIVTHRQEAAIKRLNLTLNLQFMQAKGKSISPYGFKK